MTAIKTYIKRHWKGIAIMIAAGFLILWNVHMFRVNWRAEKKAEVAEQNLKAAQDSVRIIRDREGRVSYERLAYLTNSIRNLERLNSELAREVKAVKGNVTTIIQGDVRIVEKPVPFLVKGQLIDSVVTANFIYDSVYSPGNYKRLRGYTKYDLRTGVTTGEKTYDEMGIRFVTGIKDLDKGKPEIFIRSDYPGFTVTEIEGAVLDPNLFTPKKKVPLITPSLFVGWTPVSVNTKDQVVRVNPTQFSAGVGISFNLFKITGIKK